MLGYSTTSSTVIVIYVITFFLFSDGYGFIDSSHFQFQQQNNYTD